MKESRRFIEESFPFKEVSIESAKERYKRRGSISTLHPWWARRPLAASRAIAFAALIPWQNSKRKIDETNEFTFKLSKWESASNQILLQKARQEIINANHGNPPKILDPFAGGGAIPLEAIRLGCEVHSGDLNPVAILIQKCTIEYPQKYCNLDETNSEWGGLSSSPSENMFLRDIQKWGEWILEYTTKRIGRFYPSDENGLVPFVYFWARTVQCQNPLCRSEIPLMRQYWLANKRRKIAVFPTATNNDVQFKIVGDGYAKMPDSFDPSLGSIKGAIATCLQKDCGFTVDAKTMRKLANEGKLGQRLVAIGFYDSTMKTKKYRVANEKDLKIAKSAEKELAKIQEDLSSIWGADPLPDEKITSKRPSPNARGTSAVTRYGMKTWGAVFNKRQSLVLISMADKVRELYDLLISKDYDSEYAKAIVTYLALLVSKITATSNTLVRWLPSGESVAAIYARPALAMVWDYPELNTLTGSFRTFRQLLDDMSVMIETVSNVGDSASVKQFSATKIPYPDNHFDAIFTDPPYYDNIPYSHLADFFYVWLKRMLPNVYPDLFSTPLTPKNKEIVAYSQEEGGWEAGKERFEQMLSSAFKEITRVLKPEGIAVIVYAHKSTEGWETLINSLIDSGLVVNASWPIHTEMSNRLMAIGTASLASSIYIVTRKMQKEDTAIYKDVKEAITSYLDRRLESLWNDGIGGADFFIAAIGSAIEIYGKYQNVIDLEGRLIRADKLMDDVREIATNYAIRKILRNGFSDDVSNLTRFYLLFRWNYQSMRVEFDEARKLAQSCGIDLTEHWSGTGFIKKEKEFIRVLGPHERKLDELDGYAELIDVLHRSLLLWSKNRRDEIPELLAEANLNRSETFWRVAQAVSETLTIQDREKKLLDGFLSGRNAYADREPHEQVTVEGIPVKIGRKKEREKESSKMNIEDEYEQVELE